MSRGYDKKRSLEFEHTRVICWMIALSTGSKEVPRSMQDFWRLPTDENAIEEEKEDLNALQARLMAQYAAAFPTKFKN